MALHFRAERRSEGDIQFRYHDTSPSAEMCGKVMCIHLHINRPITQYKNEIHTRYLYHSSPSERVCQQ